MPTNNRQLDHTIPARSGDWVALPKCCRNASGNCADRAPAQIASPVGRSLHQPPALRAIAGLRRCGMRSVRVGRGAQAQSAGRTIGAHVQQLQGGHGVEEHSLTRGAKTHMIHNWVPRSSVAETWCAGSIPAGAAASLVSADRTAVSKTAGTGSNPVGRANFTPSVNRG